MIFNIRNKKEKIKLAMMEKNEKRKKRRMKNEMERIRPFNIF